MSTPPKFYKAYCLECYEHIEFVSMRCYGQASFICSCGFWFPKAHYQKHTRVYLKRFEVFKRFFKRLKKEKKFYESVK